MASEAGEQGGGEAPGAAHPALATSRVCVKNLPKHVDERRLREHFSAKGEVTDAKIMRTKDGKSRQFGFVGFRSAGEAQAAVKYFDKSFLDTSRLVVEFAFKYGTAQEALRAWSKYTSGTSANKKAAQAGAGASSGANAQPLGAAAGAAEGEGGAKKARDRKKNKGQEPRLEEEDPKLAEFLQLMQPRSKQAIWSNEDAQLAAGAGGGAGRGGAPAGGAGAAAAAAEGVRLEEGGEGSEDEEEYQDLPEGAGASPSASESESDEDEEEGSCGPEGPQDAVVRDAAVSDMDYLRSRVRAKFDSDDEDGEPSARGAAGGHGDGSGSSSGEEDRAGEGSSESDGEQPAGPGPSSLEQQQRQQQKQQQQQRGRLKAAAAAPADEAEDELDAIFGGAAGRRGDDGGGGSEEEGAEEGNGGEPMEEDEASEGAGGEEEEGEGTDGAEEGADGATRERPATVVAAADGDPGIAETGRLFVRNLPYGAAEGDLRELFERFGEVSEAHLVLDKLTKKSKGFALIQFASPEDAVQAHAELDGSIFMGRLLHILPGKRPPPPPAAAEGEDGEGGAQKKGSYKEEKEKALKASAGNRAAWNTLFMRADTVAEAIASHYGVTKAELLDREAPDMAVRMALGETHVIAETKRQLGGAGASVELLESAAAASGKASQTKGVPRSDRVLLVKNLPFSSSEAELEALFGAVGTLGRLVLPSTRTLALVEFLEPQDARRAFKSLAYKRFQHVPLYLEWAPKGIFSTPPPPPGQRAQRSQQAAAAEQPKKAAKGEAAAVATLAAPADEADTDSSTIYVKNLAWATEDGALRKHFESAANAAGGKLRAAKVAKRKGPDGKMLSAGYGFVECSSEDVAKEVIRALQGSTLDAHKLALQLSTHKTAAAAAGEAAKGGKEKKPKLPDTTKMVVRNVAFEATRKDILGLFTPFGHVKSCRLPRKFDGTHRGFAFVDFATKQEARNAMEGVAGAHLYGRRLVLEWAEEEGGLDELRAKTAARSRAEQGPGGEAGLGMGAATEGMEEEMEEVAGAAPRGAGGRRPAKKQRRK